MAWTSSTYRPEKRSGLRHTLGRALAAVVVATAGLAWSIPAQRVGANPAPTVNWIAWTDPGSFPNSGSFLESPLYPPYTYNYATEALGSITMPDSSIVFVKLAGEVVRKDGNAGPSGFGVSGSGYWSGRLYSGSGQAYISTNVPNLPNNGDRIGVVGNYVASQSLSFYSDSNRTQPVNVSNIVMNIYSLGGPTLLGAWDFNQVFSILSDNRSVNQDFGFTKSAPVSGTHRLSAREGSGTIQFNGSFNSISWTVTEAEAFATWNIGVTSFDPPLDVTFDTQGGSSIAAQTTALGGSVTDPGAPTRDGHTFAGWFTSASGGSPLTFPHAHGQNTAFTLYAQWIPNNFAVTYDTQGGSTIADGSTTVGAMLADPGTPTREGYTFAGWFTSASGGSPLTFPHAHGQNAAFTLYAQWIVQETTTTPAPPTTTTPTATGMPTTTAVAPTTTTAPRTSTFNSGSAALKKSAELPSTGTDRSSTFVWAALLLTVGALTIAKASRARTPQR